MVLVRRPGAALAEIEAVYRARFGQFCSVAAAILDSREAARDVVQDAFANAVRHRREFRGEGSLDAWLWRAVVNTALSERRTGRYGAAAEPETPLLEPGTDDDIRAAIRDLPERQRLVVFLRYWADLEYAAIAEALAVAPGTVAAALHAAHGSLRNHLQEVRT
jgi:RNA polymerase sigma-70 factor, ECF subfamily